MSPNNTNASKYQWTLEPSISQWFKVPLRYTRVHWSFEAFVKRMSNAYPKVSTIYNLQTMIVSGFDRLTKLPDDFSKLKDLRHFDTRDPNF
ncbi:LOW QUALITY PROTEIN: hypothetical protein OSB04_011108 [Centaurea solstitialis]|uniref:Uncharacterized protein n=1 Tax=Centaurea solstitialis TaxID=347529 RepID=A0AA38TAI6_9ASTR|nr:LOW QUALITY PROTEIN: hypothetical protein OSB04_011108 [Centaurea solstitialis]